MSSPRSLRALACSRLAALTLLVGACWSLEAARPARALDLLVGSRSQSRITRYNAVTGAAKSDFVTAGSGGLDSVGGMVFGPDGNLYVTSTFSDEVLRYDGDTGAFLGVFVHQGSGGLEQPYGLEFGPDGNLYVASGGSGAVLRYNGTTGAVIGPFVAPHSGGLNFPIGIRFDDAGHLFVSDVTGGQILRYNATTGAFQQIFVPFSVINGSPEFIEIGPDANLYVTTFKGQVLRFDGKTGASLGPFVPAGTGGSDKTNGMAFGPDGNLYVASFGSSAVLRYNAATGAFVDEFVHNSDGPLALTFSHCNTAGPVLCLGGGRFAVGATWKTGDGNHGNGKAVGLTGDTGYFWFFDQANVELVVKVLDGCTANARFWAFAGGLTNVETTLTVRDMHSGRVRGYKNPQGTAFKPVQDTSALAACGQSATREEEAAAASDDAAAPSADGELEALLASGASTPVPITADSCTGLCLNGSRFQVSATWETGDGNSGTASPVKLTADTGYLWFFSAGNVEAVVKVIDGCGLNDRYWVFAGGLTNVRVVLTVRDTQTGATKTYTNPQGKAFQPIQDTSAFATCP